MTDISTIGPKELKFSFSCVLGVRLPPPCDHALCKGNC